MGCLMAFVFKMGAAGMWIGFVSGLTFSSLFLNTRFFKILKRKAFILVADKFFRKKKRYPCLTKCISTNKE
jgi:Na+-driven multidrug efflux pump